jgi:hypothetical protein
MSSFTLVSKHAWGSRYVTLQERELERKEQWAKRRKRPRRNRPPRDSRGQGWAGAPDG